MLGMNHKRNHHSRPLRSQSTSSFRPSFEALEDRVVPSHVQTILELPTEPANYPEGVTVDAEDGTVYFGNRVNIVDQEGNFVGKTSEIFRIDPDDGTVAEYTTDLPSTEPGTSGLLGLATRDGDVYAALEDSDSDRGVYRISQNGSHIEKFADSQDIAFPNAITFDNAGYMYVTDSEEGAVFRYEADNPEKEGIIWAQDELLRPFEADPYGFEGIPGANGIAFFSNPSPRLYVANTEKGLIAEIPINPDGTAGTVDTVANTGPFGPLGTIDGLQVDHQGDIHGVIPGFAFLSAVTGTNVSPMVQVDADSGEITPTVTEPEDVGQFDTPLSLAFDTSHEDRDTLFVTNGDLVAIPPEGPGEPGPGIVRVDLGVAGTSASQESQTAALTSGQAGGDGHIEFTSTADHDAQGRTREVGDDHAEVGVFAETPAPSLGAVAGSAPEDIADVTPARSPIAWLSENGDGRDDLTLWWGIEVHG